MKGSAGVWKKKGANKLPHLPAPGPGMVLPLPPVMKFPILICSVLMVHTIALGGVAPQVPAQVGHPSFLSPHSRPVALDGEFVFVANTPADTVDVIDRRTRRVVRRIAVGVDPVSLALRPDGKELWVSNHVSDSVSVIDLDANSPTRFHVVATVQDLDPRTKATRFDEPVGIAFASNEKAYVALSSENRIAVVNTRTRAVEKRLNITAQDPRALVVRGDRLYVIPFESNNKTQLSGGYRVDGELVTFNAHEHSIANNNVLSLGHVTDIVKHPRVPDRDLYIFDTGTDRLVQTVDTLGTLLYGLTVDSKGQVYIAQTDARNDVNGRSGTKKHGLVELENRAFLNQVTKVLPGKGEAAEFLDLEPRPPRHPAREEALATPFAIQISGDDSTLVVSAAGSDVVCTMDATSGAVLGRVRVGSVPRGIALEPTRDGGLAGAWVLNAVANTVSLLDLSEPARPRVEKTIPLEDPTHPAFKRGRIAFNKAAASTTATFSCASCHPDGHTDQLLWVLETPIVTGGNQIMPRSTMPVRGLRDTAPFHWDGIPGDPYGGNNSASTRRHVAPNCDEDEPESATRHVIDGSLATTMMMVGSKKTNEEGKAGFLSADERNDMAKFLLNVTYPPAQRRAFDNKLTERAEEGFELFHITGDAGGTPGANHCGDCHRMPFWVSTNTPGSGMDAPTWRGAHDRFLILPQGRLNIIDFDFYRRVAEAGNDERRIWQFSWGGRSAFDAVWDMVLEGSTGFSGSFARQVTLNGATHDDALTGNVLDALEKSAGEGAIVLQVEGVSLVGGEGVPVVLQYDARHENGAYVQLGGAERVISREKLTSLASEGRFVGTFTARHGAKDDFDSPQPALWTQGPIHQQRGRQQFPVLHEQNRVMTISGRHLEEGAHLIVNGRRVAGTVTALKDKAETVQIELKELPETGIHFLQVQNRAGLFSNDFIFHVADDAEHASLVRYLNNSGSRRGALHEAVARGDLAATTRFLKNRSSVNERNGSGSTPLSSAALHGHLEIAELLIEKGARVSGTNRDGNTPLHIAAFLCREEMVELLLKHGASLTKRNNRQERALETVSGEWSDGLRQFYEGIIEGANLDLDADGMEKRRREMSVRLRERASRGQN